LYKSCKWWKMIFCRNEWIHFRICWTFSSLMVIRTAGELLLLDTLSPSEVITGLPNQNQPDSKSYLFSPQVGRESDMCICTFYHEDALLHWLFQFAKGQWYCSCSK
jgi:hypothetical protein